MIETLPVSAASAEIAISAEALAGFAELRAALAGRSQIVWSEHCSECAYPKCYETCAFYTPRPDLHCRRFEAGIEPVRSACAAGLHRIRFRQWGKLEGRGAAAILPVARARRRDRLDARLSSLIAAAPAPYMLKRKLAARWNTQKDSQASPVGALEAQAFVIEALAADGLRHGLTLTLLNVGENTGGMFQTRFEAGPDYQRLTVPIEDIRARIDLSAPFLVQIEPIGDAAGRAVVFGVCDFVRFKAEAAVQAATPADARPVKVVVWDLDETLWTGTLAEDGAEAVRLRPEAEAAIKALDERGVLQSIASKNDEAEAMAALRGFGLADYFLHPQIHWNPKSQSIAHIAAALDLGIDSFVFIDDQPFERAEVAARHPAVRCVAHTEVAGLSDHAWFDLPVTPESRKRRAMYQAEVDRAAAFQSTGDDYLAFLRASDIHIRIAALNVADAERVYELSQRTNQLNFRGAKYAREAVQAMLAPGPDQRFLTIRCADRFGDYGLIGFVALDLRLGEITDLFMSCRVQRKRVEHAIFAWIAGGALRRGHRVLSARHSPTARNGASRALLEDLGFEPSAGGDIWSRDAGRPFEDSDVARIVVGPAAEAA